MVGHKPMHWTVSTTELTPAQAEQASRWIDSEFDHVHADPIDPSDWFTLSLDRWTAELLRDALRSLALSGGDPGGLLEDVDDWLSNQAKPYSPDTDSDDRYRPVVP